jgi:hypothetical protein
VLVVSDQYSSILLDDDEGRRPQWLGMACATVITVVAVGSFGIWYVRGTAGVRPSEPAAQSLVTWSGATEPPEAIVHEPARLPYSDLFAAELLYFLVDSEDQAAAIRRLGDHANFRRIQAGQRPALITVLVPGTSDPAILEVVREQAGVSVIDLREP